MRIECTISQTMNRKTINLIITPPIKDLLKTDPINLVTMMIDFTEEGEQHPLYKAAVLGNVFNQVAPNITKSITPDKAMKEVRIERPKNLSEVEYNISYKTRTVGAVRVDWQTAVQGASEKPQKDIYAGALFLIDENGFQAFDNLKERWDLLPVIFDAIKQINPNKK